MWSWVNERLGCQTDQNPIYEKERPFPLFVLSFLHRQTNRCAKIRIDLAQYNIVDPLIA